MEQPDERVVNNTGNKPPPSQNPSQAPSSATNNEPETVYRQELPDSETINVNNSGNHNPIIGPEAQSSSPSNHQNPDTSSPSSPTPPPPNIHGEHNQNLDPSLPLPSKIPCEDYVSNSESTAVLGSPSNSSDDDFSIRSMPDPGPAIQNPTMHVMERADEPSTPSAYRIPSRVFDRTNTGAPEWSVASNESLFSIHMGNMSFSRELEWLNSEMSGPLPPLTSDNNINNGGNANKQSRDNKPNDPSTGNQSQANNLNDTSKGDDQSQVNKPNDNYSISSTGDQSQANKFNSMSQSVGRFHQDHDEMTEAKAAETMRQVIMESSDDYDLSSCVSMATRVDGSNHNNGSHHNDDNVNELSRPSDCSAKSFTFNLRPEGGRSQRSPRGFQVQERPKQKTQTQRGTPKESSKASTHKAKKPSSNSNAPFKWLCCFTCCIRQ